MKRISVVSLLAVGLSLLLSAGAFAEEAKVKVGNNVGEKLAAFQVEDTDGQAWDSATVLGKQSAAFLMIAPSCSLCRSEVDEFVQKAADKAGQIYIVVAAPQNAAKRFLNKYDGPFKVLIDPNYDAMTAMNFRVTPSTLVVDSKGVVVKKFSQYKEGQVSEVVGSL